MKSPTIRDAALEARAIAEPLEAKQTEKIERIWENVATIISLLVIELTLALFVYNEGYGSVYNIPAKIMPLDLKMYLPFAAFIVSISVYIICYMTIKRRDNVFKKDKFNWEAVAWLGLICLTILNRLHMEKIIGMVACIVVSVIIALLFEVFLLRAKRLKNRNFENKEISEQEKENKIEDYIWNRLFYVYMFRYGVAVIIILTSLAFLLGTTNAKVKSEYQICVYDSQTYAVIVDYDDRVLAEKAYINDNSITISTGTYRYLPKDSMELSFKSFKSVTIQNDLPLKNLYNTNT